VTERKETGAQVRFCAAAAAAVKLGALAKSTAGTMPTVSTSRVAQQRESEWDHVIPDCPSEEQATAVAAGVGSVACSDLLSWAVSRTRKACSVHNVSAAYLK